MKIGSSSINVKLGTTQIQKVMHGTVLVWQNKTWVTHTGNLVTMTSNTTPTPYSIEVLGNGAITSGNAYHIFDNNANTEVDFTATGAAKTIVKLSFGKKIKIKKIYINSGSTMNASNPNDKGLMITTNATSISDIGTTLIALSGDYSSSVTGVTKNCLEPDLATDNICLVLVQIGHTLGIRGIMITEWQELE